MAEETQDILPTDNAESATVKHTFITSIMKGDNMIWGIYILLVCISIVEIFSATSQLTYKAASSSDPAFSHIKNLFFGAIILLLTQSMSLRSMHSWDKLTYGAGIVFLALTLFFGAEQKGATRAFMGIQPVEFCKLGVIWGLCAALTARDQLFQKLRIFRDRTARKRYWFYLILIAIPVLPIATQNLSSAIIICMASLAVMFLAKVKGKYLCYTLIAVFALAGVGVSALYGVYRVNKGVEPVESSYSSRSDEESALDKALGRASTWANRIFDHSGKPLWEEDMSGKKSQEIYAHMALANSYPFGRFIGNSRLRDFLPEAFSDYIFAIIFEEWGFLGAVFVLMLYLFLLFRCYVLSCRTSDMYIRLLLVGLPLIMVIQALIHIGVCTGAMFVTGQPLPLISRGGSSIFFTSISFGIILALSRLIRHEQEMLQTQSDTTLSES